MRSLRCTVEKLERLIADRRCTRRYRFMDTLSLVSWWRRLESEKKAPEDRSLHTIERLQVLSALLLAPTEVICE